METDFIYWGHHTPAGVKVEEIFGGDDKPLKVWHEMAMQVYGEQGKDRYRVIEHTADGAPLLADSQQRVSITHSISPEARLLCIASLPRTPEADLSLFTQRTAMGIDCERADRQQVVKVRDRVLNDDELHLVDADDVQANVLAWTCKEALYKAALTPGLDFRTQLIITRLPAICTNPASPADTADKQGGSNAVNIFGKALIKFDEQHSEEMQLYSYLSEGHIVTIAYSPKCAKFKNQSGR